VARRQVRFDAEEELIDAIDKMLEDTEYSRSAWIRILLRESLQRMETRKTYDATITMRPLFEYEQTSPGTISLIMDGEKSA
jgi:metal-responsive CopG/Arc/MetJ family transcriptional regulator